MKSTQSPLDTIVDCLSLFNSNIDWAIYGNDYLVLNLKSKNQAKKVVKRMKFKSLVNNVKDIKATRDVSSRVAITWED